MKIILVQIILLAGFNVFANDDSFDPKIIEVQGNNLSLEAFGDGTEYGFAYTLKNVLVRSSAAKLEADLPQLEVEIRNNFANCEPYTTILEARKKTYHNGNTQSHHWLVDYRVEVNVSVDGESGGCLALITLTGSDDILRIINYKYTTDY